MSGRIHVFPAWEQNPYLNMLYVGARAEGWRVEGSKTVNALEQALPELGDGDILHLHWTSPVLNHTPTYADAVTALSRFETILDELHRAGARLIWTVHNALAHDAKHPDLEIALARILATKSDLIIQLNSSTRDVVAEHYEIPVTKLVTLRHASYAGVYATPPTQHAARRLLGIADGSPVVGFVGQIRAYKGIPTLLRALDIAKTSIHDVVLVLAGKTPSGDIAEIERLLPTGVPVVRKHSFIDDSEIANWFAACDVMVFPYERVLNSGSVLLSATFGKPCILPAEPHLVAEYRAQPWVTFYEPGVNAESSLADAIPLALSKGRGAGISALRFAAEYTTSHMAWDYVALIEKLGGVALPKSEASL